MFIMMFKIMNIMFIFLKGLKDPGQVYNILNPQRQVQALLGVGEV